MARTLSSAVQRKFGELLALWTPSGSQLVMTDDFFGAPHPWSGRTDWQRPGVLQLQRCL